MNDLGRLVESVPIILFLSLHYLKIKIWYRLGLYDLTSITMSNRMQNTYLLCCGSVSYFPRSNLPWVYPAAFSKSLTSSLVHHFVE